MQRVIIETCCACAGATALMVAAGKGRLDDVITLLANGADAAARSRDGSTAADWADRFGYPDVSEFLADHLEVSGCTSTLPA